MQVQQVCSLSVGEESPGVGVRAELAVVGLMVPVGTTSFGPVRMSVSASSVKLIKYKLTKCLTLSPVSVHASTLPENRQWF